MVKITCAAVKTAIAIASHLIHRGLPMRKNIDDEPHAAKIRRRAAGEREARDGDKPRQGVVATTLNSFRYRLP
jgi:hypothetical protein